MLCRLQQWPAWRSGRSESRVPAEPGGCPSVRVQHLPDASKTCCLKECVHLRRSLPVLIDPGCRVQAVRNDRRGKPVFHGPGHDECQIPVERFQLRIFAFLKRDVGGYGFTGPCIDHRDLKAILTVIPGLRLIKRFKFTAIDLEDHTVCTLPMGRDQGGFAGTVFADLREIKREMIGPGVCEITCGGTPVRSGEPAGQQVGAVREVGKPAQVSASQRAASLAKYVRMASAPARLMASSDSITQLRSSSQPFWAAALSMLYSPLTW